MVDILVVEFAKLEKESSQFLSRVRNVTYSKQKKNNIFFWGGGGVHKYNVQVQSQMPLTKCVGREPYIKQMKEKCRS